MPASASAGRGIGENAQASPGSAGPPRGAPRGGSARWAGKSRAPVARARSRCSPRRGTQRPVAHGSPRPRRPRAPGRGARSIRRLEEKTGGGRCPPPPAAAALGCRRHPGSRAGSTHAASRGSAPTAGRAQASSSRADPLLESRGAKSASAPRTRRTRRRSTACGRPAARSRAIARRALRRHGRARRPSRRGRPKERGGSHTSVARGRPCLRPPLTAIHVTFPGHGMGCKRKTFTSAPRDSASRPGGATANRASAAPRSWHQARTGARARPGRALASRQAPAATDAGARSVSAHSGREEGSASRSGTATPRPRAPRASRPGPGPSAVCRTGLATSQAARCPKEEPRAGRSGRKTRWHTPSLPPTPRPVCGPSVPTPPSHGGVILHETEPEPTAVDGDAAHLRPHPGA